MSETKKPNVFPTKDSISKPTASESVYSEPIIVDETLSFDEQEAIRTAEQKRLRDEAYKKSSGNDEVVVNNEPPKPPVNNGGGSSNEDDEFKEYKRKKAIEDLSQPQMNQSFDVIPLPSGGKLYGLGKSSVKVAYMTTADENILSSPNLVNSGDFLEILINRKLLEPKLRYKDLLMGDRNAIMIWLRSTAYGEMYPVTVYDDNGVAVDSEVDLSELKINKLNAEPDSDGLFECVLPVSKDVVKFRLLTIGDIELLTQVMEERKDEFINTESTLLLESQIVSINGEHSRTFIEGYIEEMRVMDSRRLREVISSVDCGVDLSVEIALPDGGILNTFLPLTSRFFWPDYDI